MQSAPWRISWRFRAGYSVTWSGQFEYLERATARLQIVVPFTLAIIFVLLYLTFRSAGHALLMMTTLPFALVGGFWLIYLLGHHVSVASGVGFIALAGVAAEFGVVMLIYLDQSIHATTTQRRIEYAAKICASPLRTARYCACAPKR